MTTKKNYPRTCDIDIIDFNGVCFKMIYGAKNPSSTYTYAQKKLRFISNV